MALWLYQLCKSLFFWQRYLFTLLGLHLHYSQVDRIPKLFLNEWNLSSNVKLKMYFPNPFPSFVMKKSLVHWTTRRSSSCYVSKNSNCPINWRGKIASGRTPVSGKVLTKICSAMGTSDELRLEVCFFHTSYRLPTFQSNLKMVLEATFPNNYFTIAPEVWLEIHNIKQKIVKKLSITTWETQFSCICKFTCCERLK